MPSLEAQYVMATNPAKVARITTAPSGMNLTPNEQAIWASRTVAEFDRSLLLPFGQRETISQPDKEVIDHGRPSATVSAM